MKNVLSTLLITASVALGATGDIRYDQTDAAGRFISRTMVIGTEGQVVQLVSGRMEWRPAGGLPAMGGQNGKFLTTDGSVASWATVVAGGTTWGGIIGTLSNQTDLQNALNAKLATNGNGSSLTGLTGPQVGFADTDNNFNATNVQAALEELDDVINGGLPNAGAGKVDWSQIVNMPTGFADGSDDGTGGGGTGANPTASVGLAAANGVATTFMRSDAAPPISLTMAPTWTGLHTFTSAARQAGISHGGSFPWYLGNGSAWATYAVPYFRPTGTNKGVAFDIMPNGTMPGIEDAHIDICSTDIVADSANFETLELKKTLTYAHVGTKKFGTGTQRYLVLNESSQGVDGAGISIGINQVPTALVHIYQSGLTQPPLQITNANTNTGPQIYMDGAGQDYIIGSNAAAHPSGPRWFYIQDVTGGIIRYRIDDTGMTTVTGPLRLTNGATSAGSIRISEDADDGANFASFTVPPLAANTVYTLPPDDGDPGEQLQTNGAGLLTWEPPGSGGGGTPGGVDTQVQFNDVGVFGGDTGFTYNKTTKTLTLDTMNVTTMNATSANAPTPSAGDDDTSVATTSFVNTQTRGGNTGTHSTPSTANPLTLSFTAIMQSVWYAANGTINLPAAAGYAGRSVMIYNTGAFTVTIDPSGSEVVVRDGTVQTGGVSFTLSTGAGNFVALISDGVRWVTLGFKGTLAVGS